MAIRYSFYATLVPVRVWISIVLQRAASAGELLLPFRRTG